MNYSQKHPLYMRGSVKRAEALDLYEGGARVEGNPAYLTRHPFENEKQWKIRQERATYRNFAAPIVDVFTSSICDGRPARTLPAELEAMLGNVDRHGALADVFFADVARLAAAGGSRFVLVDMEPAKGLTLAENDSAGRRNFPYFTAIDADDVWDWGLDEAGLSWVVLHSLEIMEAMPFTAPSARDILTIWTRDEWRRLASPPRPMDSSALAGGFETMIEDGRGAHPLGEVPVVPFLFEPVTPMTANPATDDVLSLILRIYRRDSELDKMLFDCAVPLAILNGVDKKLMDDFVRASSNVLASEREDGVSGQYLEPTGASYAALREQIDADIASVREIALRMVRPQSAVGERAEAKKIDKQQLDTQLAGFARRCASAERKCWELAWKWLNNGRAPQADAIACPYNEDYSVKDAERLDRQYLLEMLRIGAISRETYLKLLLDMGCLPEGFDPEAEMSLLEMEEKGDTEAARKLREALAG